ncbi:MAG: response regulator, partial [Candidatus Sericytochromatia bacterium]
MLKNEENEGPLIFLIDDVVQNLQLLSVSMRSAGYRISGASSGEAALRLLKQSLPDLILCDIMMPEMDGFEVARRLKADPKTKDIPIIFLTACHEDEEIVKGFEVGGVDFVSKPFNVAELMKRVALHLELKRTRDQLQHQREKLEWMSQEKDTLLNIAAHDMKTPLSSIILISELMQIKAEHLSPSKLLTYTLQLHNSARRIMQVISDLLDINQIEKGLKPPIMKLCNIIPILATLNTEYAPVALKKELNWCFDSPLQAVWVYTDPHYFFQILDNLISNALKFSPPEKSVKLSCREHVDHWLIEIEDQGPGFTPADLSHIYEKYAKLSAQPTGDENSTGLGVAIVNHLTRLLGLNLILQTQ